MAAATTSKLQIKTYLSQHIETVSGWGGQPMNFWKFGEVR